MDITADENPPERSPVFNREVRTFGDIRRGRTLCGERSRELYSPRQREYTALER
jgi:hypothetical protein